MNRVRRRTVTAAATVTLLAGAAVPAAMAASQHAPAALAATRSRSARTATSVPTCSADFYSIYAAGQNGEQGDQGFPDPLVFDTADRLFMEFLYGTGRSGADTFTSATDTIPGTSVPGTVNDAFFDWSQVQSQGDQDIFDTSTSDAVLSVESSQFTAGRRYVSHGSAVDANGATCDLPAHSFTAKAATQVLTVFSGRSGATVKISPRTMVFDLATERWRLGPEPVQLFSHASGRYRVIAHGTTDANGSIAFTVRDARTTSYVVRIDATTTATTSQSPAFNR